MVMQDFKHDIVSLHSIRALGVCIAIDDFDTGFSSLSYLAKLPVDTLKIDRSSALVTTIISLAHALRLKVVAEGVETSEQLRLLTSLNRDEF
jgi:sensor c-di-GMP phosphodiesterase-like protein